MNALLLHGERWAELWCDALWRATWQGAIVLAVVWAIARWCTFLSSRVTCWMWRLACLKLLVALACSAPVNIPLLPAASSSLAPAQNLVSDLSAQGPLGDSRNPSLSAVDPATVIGSRQDRTRATKVLVSAAWLAGLLCSVTIAARQWNAARRLACLSVPVRERSIRSLCRQQARRLGMRRLPELRVSRNAPCAALVGVLRPSIVLPHDALTTFSTAELGVMVGHELAHLKRRDLAWNWLLLAVRSMFFFHPLVWLMARGWSEAQESACDELVLERGIARPAEYGRLLLTLATRPDACLRASFAVAGVFGSCGNLERRILAMTRVPRLSRHYLFVATSLFVLPAIVTIIPWRLVAQEAQQPAAADTAKAAAEREPAQRSQSFNNIKQIMLAMHNFASQDKSQAFPPAYIAKDGKPLLSWRVAVLPYLDQKNLYAKFHLDEPWDSEHNKALIATMPGTYRSPMSKLTDGRTVYLVPRGATTAFPGSTGFKTETAAFVADPIGVSFKQITDGTSNTIAVVEVDDEHAVPWTKPDDWNFNPADPKAGLNGAYSGKFLVGFCDGSAHALPIDINPDRLKALVTIAGGEPVVLP